MADKNMKAKINVEFEESASRQQLNSGEDITTLFGKVRKFFSDLKAVAFSGAYSDLSGAPESLPANGGIAHEVKSPNVKAQLYEDGEGGNLRLVSPDGVHYMEMDLFDDKSLFNGIILPY